MLGQASRETPAGESMWPAEPCACYTWCGTCHHGPAGAWPSGCPTSGNPGPSASQDQPSGSGAGGLWNPRFAEVTLYVALAHHKTRREWLRETSTWLREASGLQAGQRHASGSVSSPYGTVPGTMSSTRSGAGGRVGTCSAWAPCAPVWWGQCR